MSYIVFKGRLCSKISILCDFCATATSAVEFTIQHKIHFTAVLQSKQRTLTVSVTVCNLPVHKLGEKTEDLFKNNCTL